VEVIYFAQLPTGLIKIGATIDLKTRLAALSSDYGAELTLLAAMSGDRSTKYEIHKRFADLRIDRTDLFEPGPALMEFIGGLTRECLTSKSVKSRADRKK
jgi:Meiotically up-regulated gene 113